jgi:hypothetical protein
MAIIVSPSGGDDTAAIQAAINSLGPRGGDVIFTPGDYIVSDVINVGNGFGATPSTRWGIRLRGEGAPGWYYGPPFGIPWGNWNRAPVVLKWTGPANRSMIRVSGPLVGWSIENLFLDGQSVGGVGLEVCGASCGDVANLCIDGFAKGIVGISSGDQVSFHNYFRNTRVWVPHIQDAIGILLTGIVQGNTDASGWVFNNTTILLPGNDFSCTGIYLQMTDGDVFIHTHIAGGGPNARGVVFDHGMNPPYPGGVLFIDNNCEGNAGTIPYATWGTPDPGGSPHQVIGHPGAGLGTFPYPVNVNILCDNAVNVKKQIGAQAHIPATGETGILLATNRSGTVTLDQVKLGSTNSGGSGKRALVVPN